MTSRRTILFSILFLVLIVSLFAVIISNLVNHLRVDSVPAGTYVVPWMKPFPPIGELPPWFDIEAVMSGALKLSMTFTIEMWDGSTRIIPSTVYLGHDSEFLYVGGRFVGMGSNPSSEPHGWSNANDFRIYFDVANSGNLKTPEAGSCFAVYIDVPQDVLGSYSWHDMLWVYDPTTYKHMMWMPADNYLNGQQTVYSTAAHAQGYDNSTETVTMLFARYLSKPEITNIDALQMKLGERWVMGFLLELEFQGTLDYRVDGWPETTFGIWSSNSSWWPKLAIDLSNPPATYFCSP